MADANPSGNTPAADDKEKTPPAGNPTPSQPSKEETVTLSKEEHDRLQKEAAQAREAQSRADKIAQDKEKAERQARMAARKKVAEPQLENFEQAELQRAKDMITGEVLANPDYQKLISGNKLLAKTLAQEPWRLLDQQDGFVDAQDLADQVLTALDTELEAATKKPEGSNNAQPEPQPNPAPAPAASNPGGNAAPTKTEQELEEERLKKLPVHERIKARIQGRVNVKK